MIGADGARRRVGGARLLRRVAADAAEGWFGSGAAEVVPGHDRLHARVPLADVRDARGAVGVAREPDARRVEQLPERVVGGVQARLDAPVLLGRVAGAGRRSSSRRVTACDGRGEEEVERVRRCRRRTGGRRSAPGTPSCWSGASPALVGLALALRVRREHDVAGLRERLRGEPVELLVGLHRAVRDHDARPLRRAGLGGPHVPGDRGAVARREQHGLHDPVALRPPVVEARVAGAAVLAARAQVAGEVALGVGGLQRRARRRGSGGSPGAAAPGTRACCRSPRAPGPWRSSEPRWRGRTRARPERSEQRREDEQERR